MRLEEEYEYYSDEDRADFELTPDEIVSCESDGDDYGELSTLIDLPETNPYIEKRKAVLKNKMTKGR